MKEKWGNSLMYTLVRVKRSGAGWYGGYIG